MSNANRIYLKFEGLDWDDDESIDAFARSLHLGLVNQMDSNRDSRPQEQDENESE